MKAILEDSQNVYEDFNFIMSFNLLENAKMLLKCPEYEEYLLGMGIEPFF